MSFRINTNTQAALSLSSLNKTSNEIGQRQLRLATGSKINSAADDSAGFTISNKLQATTRGQAQALSNIGDAKSMLTVAEGALGSTMDILQTMKEKAVQAGNSSMGADERAAIQSQVDQLALEVQDILSGAAFNGTKLFSDTGETGLSFQIGDGAGDRFAADVRQMGLGTLGLGTYTEGSPGTPDIPAVASVATVDVSASAGNYTQYGAVSGRPTPTVDTSNWIYEDSPVDAYIKIESTGDGNGRVFVAADPDDLDGTGFGGRDIILESSFVDNVMTYNVGVGYGEFSIDFTDILAAGDDGAGFHVQLSPYQPEIVSGDPAVEAGITGGLNLMDDAGVAAALTTIDAAIKSVNETASGLGDVQNRLDFKSQNLETSMNNYEAANSRIADADFAKEQMEIVKLQILQQTGSAMFAQSNAAPQSVLSFF